MRQLIRMLLRTAAGLYPAPWRERYGAEFEALLEEVRPAGRDVWDILRGALIMQMTAWNFGKVTVGCGLAGLIVAGALAYTMPEYYVSMAVMRIAPLTAEGTSPDAARMQIQQRLQQMQLEILSRHSLTGMMMRPSLDLYHRERAHFPLEDIVQDMRNKIHIRPARPAANGSVPANLFTISYEYPNKFKAQAVVRELVAKFAEVNITQQPEKAQNLEVLDPASLPDRPSGPNRPAMLLLGLGAGLLLGLIAALLLALRKRRGVAG
jgi:hypothetical protein